jgi:hypothetical protein
MSALGQKRTCVGYAHRLGRPAPSKVGLLPRNCAVGKLLDDFQPAGKIKPPPASLQVADGTEIWTSSKYLREIYQTPETLADFVTAGILRALYSPASAAKFSEWPRPRWDDYGMESAVRDLGLKPKRRKQ